VIMRGPRVKSSWQQAERRAKEKRETGIGVSLSVVSVHANKFTPTKHLPPPRVNPVYNRVNPNTPKGKGGNRDAQVGQ